MKLDWLLYANFEEHEFTCKCGCGETKMNPTFMRRLQTLRDAVGFALPVTSGYRCPDHPAEAAKDTPGAHTRGCAVDLGVDRGRAYEVLKAATRLGFTGLGINQKGDGRFIHLDDLVNDEDHMRPTIWSY